MSGIEHKMGIVSIQYHKYRRMRTRLQQKLHQEAKLDKPKETIVSRPVIVKPQQLTDKKMPVRLTEFLLYVVNTKLRMMDKETRDEKIQNLDNDWMHGRSVPVTGPFTEIVYRKQKVLGVPQTQLAVMHKVNFDFNSTAVCKLNSMDEFFHNINRAARVTKYADYKQFLRYRCPAGEAQVKNPIARFIQLPKGYYRPHSDCTFFGELAWPENGVMTVEADNFALCLTIWQLKEWLVNPIRHSYPLSCQLNMGDICNGRNLLQAMWTDDRLRTFLKDRSIFQHVDRYSYDDDEGNDRIRELLEHNYLELYRAHDEMKDYARKLLTGEEMVSRSIRSLNVLSASQLHRLLEKFELVLRCLRYDLTHFDVHSEW